MAGTSGQVVLVTGGSGFLGRHVVQHLENSSSVAEVKVFDIKPYVSESKKVTGIAGDIRQLADLSEALRGVDAVIHSAALVSFGVFPDFKGMEEINVQGTKNVIQACLEQNVQRLVYTSSVDVVVGYDDIVNGDEDLPIPRDFLVPGYADTKYEAECLVLEANGKPLPKGGYLRTAALRPNVMYGDGDPFYVTAALKTAAKSKGVLPRVGDGKTPFQQAFVGNVAWGHVVANDALSRDRSVGGKAYFLTDDTPLMNTFSFMEIFLKPRGFSLSTYSLPYCFVYCLLFVVETFLRLISPLYKKDTTTTLNNLIYINKTYYYSRKRAEQLLGYKPKYSFSESVAKSLPFYEKWSPHSS